MADPTGTPVHRAWFGALKADRSVPSGTMQIARVFSDFAARTAGKHVHVTYAALSEETHASNDAISRAIKDLVQRGYLAPDGVQAKGKRTYYNLTTAGQVIHNLSGRRRGEVIHNLSDQRRTTSPITGEEPLRSAESERQNAIERHQSPAEASGPDAALRRLGGTDEQIDWIKSALKARGARDVSAVLRAEVESGNARTLLVEAARATYTRPEWCGRCDESSRLVDLPDGRAARCPACHPQAARRPLRAVS